MKRVVGITGGIASGKSTVSKIMRENGFHVIDADKITAEIYRKDGRGADIIRANFGDEFINRSGSVNKRRLKKLVFNSPDNLILLNKCIHPVIKDIINDRLGSSGNDTVIEAALLFEGGLDEFCDEVWLVAVSPEIQLERLKKRDNISDEMMHRIINSQNCYSDKMDKIDKIIYNNGNMDDLRSVIRELLDEQ